MAQFHFPDMEELFIGIMMLLIAAVCLLFIAIILTFDNSEKSIFNSSFAKLASSLLFALFARAVKKNNPLTIL